jgi:hypothetical protein
LEALNKGLGFAGADVRLDEGGSCLGESQERDADGHGQEHVRRTHRMDLRVGAEELRVQGDALELIAGAMHLHTYKATPPPDKRI